MGKSTETQEKKVMRMELGKLLYNLRVIGAFIVHMGNFKVPVQDDIKSA